MNFWDSSAIIALVAEGPMAPVARRVLDADGRVAVWWGTSVECAATLARKEREDAARGDSVADAAVAAERGRRLGELEDEWHEVHPGRRLQALARRLVRVHPLTAPDGLQLAAAITLAEDQPEGVGFLSFDAQLNRAASREGFTLPTPGPEAVDPPGLTVPPRD
ncbi:MAG: type II toxin-antitoxin system VapC family toxin [Gammaproteobacteria bacterium]|nr:type II toxin-antitoxin system VapC family toxin [Gammaproteobacteria bacterium]